jgi:hypothetical protein
MRKHPIFFFVFILPVTFFSYFEKYKYPSEGPQFITGSVTKRFQIIKLAGAAI